MANQSVEVLENPEALARRAAGWITDLAAASRDRFDRAATVGDVSRVRPIGPKCPDIMLRMALILGFIRFCPRRL